MRTVYVHGAGDDGPTGWPASLDGPDAVFVRRVPGVVGDDPLVDARRLVRLASGDPVNLVAWSYGGIAALLATHAAPYAVRSLVLFEPSCADLAEEADAVRSFRHAYEPVLALGADPGVPDDEFLAAFAAATSSPLPQDPGMRAQLAARLRATPAPWSVPVPRGPLPVPTLVVTGGWAAYFEDIAGALVRLGAEHRVLRGHGHAVPAHPEVPALLRAFPSECER